MYHSPAPHVEHKMARTTLTQSAIDYMHAITCRGPIVLVREHLRTLQILQNIRQYVFANKYYRITNSEEQCCIVG